MACAKIMATMTNREYLVSVSKFIMCKLLWCRVLIRLYKYIQMQIEKQQLEFQFQCGSRSIDCAPRRRIRADRNCFQATGKAIECDADGPPNPDRKTRCGRMCLSSMTWLPAAGGADDDIALDCSSADDCRCYCCSLVMSDGDADEIHFHSFRWRCSASSVAVELFSAASERWQSSPCNKPEAVTVPVAREELMDQIDNCTKLTVSKFYSTIRPCKKKKYFFLELISSSNLSKRTEIWNNPE